MKENCSPKKVLKIGLSGHTGSDHTHHFAQIKVFLNSTIFSRIFRHLKTPSHSNLSSRLVGLTKGDAEAAGTFAHPDDFDDVTVNLIDESGPEGNSAKTEDTKL